MQLERGVDQAFNLLENNVDGYLDWYYSLVGEYTRIMTLLAGNLENHMADKLEEYKKKGGYYETITKNPKRKLKWGSQGGTTVYAFFW